MKETSNKPKFIKQNDEIECLYCHKKFKYINNFYSHHKKIHKHDNNDEYINIANGKYKYSCKLCEKEFKSINGFKNHYTKLHKCSSKKYILITYDNITKYKCKKCDKVYSHKSGLYTHYNKIHIIEKNDSEMIKKEHNHNVDDIINMKNELNKLNKKYSELLENQKKIEKKSNKVINNKTINNVTNNTVNIQLVSYGKENLEDISEHYYIKAFQKGFISIPQFIEFIHFNDKLPQYKNICIPNERKNKVKVYKDNCWQLQDKQQTIEDIYNHKSDVLEDKYNNIHTKLDKRTKRMFQRFLDKKDDDETIEYVRGYIQELLYNKKNLVRTT